MRHFSCLTWRPECGERLRGVLSLLCPCTLQGVLWLQAELQPQSVHGGCGSQSFLTPIPAAGFLLPQSQHCGISGFSSNPTLLGRSFPTRHFSSLCHCNAQVWLGLTLTRDRSIPRPGSQAQWEPSSPAVGRAALPHHLLHAGAANKQINKHRSIKPQQLTPS